MPTAGMRAQNMINFSLAEWLAMGIVIYVLYHIASGYKDSAKTWVCKSCGYVGESGSAVRGSLGIEVILWLCFIFPRLIYTIWRRSSEYKACPQCKGDQMIPADSPIGRKIIADLAPK